MHTTINPPKQKKQKTALDESERKALVLALCGMFANSKNSSEDFARRKAEEIEREDRVR